MTTLPIPDLENTALFLDIDGTLLDIAETPGAVSVPSELTDDLSKLRDRCDGALALVSGRTLEDIDKLFAPLKFAAAGAHGTQVRPDPKAPIGHLTRPIPAELRAQFVALADRPGMFIEDKEVTLALHYRLLDGELPLAPVAAVEATAAQAGFALLHGQKSPRTETGGDRQRNSVARLHEEATVRGPHTMVRRRRYNRWLRICGIGWLGRDRHLCRTKFSRRGLSSGFTRRIAPVVAQPSGETANQNAAAFVHSQ